MVSRKNSWSSLSASSIAILVVVDVETAILARIWASRNFSGARSVQASRVAFRAVGALARDPDDDRAAAHPLAHRASPDWRTSRVGAIEIPAATGFSNETILFDAHVGRRRRRADRAPPRRAHRAAGDYTVFLEANFETQFRVMQALGEHSDVPVPKMLWFEADPAWFGSPFWIMERVDGEVPSDAPPYAIEGWLHDASAPSSRRSCGGTASRPWPRCTASTGAPLGLDFARRSRPRRTAASSSSSATTRKSLAWAEAAEAGSPTRARAPRSAWLTEHQPDSPPDAATIVWGDSRLGNQMFARRRDRRGARLGDGGARRPAHRPRLVALLRRRALDRAGRIAPARLPDRGGDGRSAGRSSPGAVAGDLHWFLVFAGAALHRGDAAPGHAARHDMGYSPEPFGYDNADQPARSIG